MTRMSRISRALNNSRPAFFSSYCIFAAFSAYFCMYAFRKPFTAATFDGAELWGIDYKPILIASQLLGYTLSKLIGIKIISEMPESRRAVTLVALIGVAQLTLLGFALVPAPYNVVMLFLNGIPLGMVFGLVLAYLEGRKVTEALSAGLCASFILSSGWVRSIGASFLEFGVSEYWMPFLTGLLFLIPFLGAVWLLRQIPQPTGEDVQLRSKRRPMSGQDRIGFFRRHWVGLTGLLVVYIGLTVVRSVRDDFSAEIWDELGIKKAPDIFAKSETLVMFGVVAINGAAIWISDNRKAFLTSLVLVSGGFFVTLFALAGQTRGWLSPLAFMVVIGLGTYVPYVAFHTTVFERLIASFREQGNVGFLMYLADTVGYVATVVVMILGFGDPQVSVVPMFSGLTFVIAVASIAIAFLLLFHFLARLPRKHEHN